MKMKINLGGRSVHLTVTGDKTSTLSTNQKAYRLSHPNKLAARAIEPVKSQAQIYLRATV